MPICLEVGSRCETSPGNGQIETVQGTILREEKQLAVVIDMWDQHWCRTHTERVAALTPRMNRALDTARGLGIQVCFLPSDVLGFYREYPQRQAIEVLPVQETLVPGEFDPPLPPWANTGGCECGPERPCRARSVWTRQHPALIIRESDLILDCNDNRELSSLCRVRGLTTLLYMGTAANMCVSWTRSSSIRQMGV